jgi:SAM-dependent MidA family methyltransferase
MAEANAHYYGTRDPLGAAGDFTTAPEISQMFGELVGLWLVDLWQRAGSPQTAIYAELGPGRGTLAQDILRAMRPARFEPPVHLVETSPVLRESQAKRVSTATWHDDLDSLPETGPLLIVANEFFDALPIRQIQRGETGWYEIFIDVKDGRFVPITSGPRLDALIPQASADAPIGSIVECSPAIESVAGALCRRLAKQGGSALIIDYGYEGPALGDTLQAVHRQASASPHEEPGQRDLTAHVDFSVLAEQGRRTGLAVCGPVDQGQWLSSLGIATRTATLAKASPERSKELAIARDRLIDANQMGGLFKVIALVAPKWPNPAAF